MKRQPSPAAAFPGMNPGETLQFYYRQHWMRLARATQAFIAGTAVYAMTLWFVAGIPEDDNRQLLLVFATAAYMLLHLVLLGRIYRHFLYVIVVTDSKIYRIKKTLVAVDDRQTIDLWSLSDVTMRQHGLFQNLFGFGTLVLHGNEEMKIHFTPRIREQLHRISGLRAQARSRFMGNAPAANIPVA